MDKKLAVVIENTFSFLPQACERSRFWKDEETFIQHDYLEADFAIKNLYQISTTNLYFIINADILNHEFRSFNDK